MKPQPLFRVLPNPSFDNRCDGLHAALDIDPPIDIARQIEWLGDLAPKRVAVAQADHPKPARRCAQDCPRRLAKFARSPRAVFPGMRLLDWRGQHGAPETTARSCASRIRRGLQPFLRPHSRINCSRPTTTKPMIEFRIDLNSRLKRAHRFGCVFTGRTSRLLAKHWLSISTPSRTTDSPQAGEQFKWQKS